MPEDDVSVCVPIHPKPIDDETPDEPHKEKEEHFPNYKAIVAKIKAKTTLEEIHRKEVREIQKTLKDLEDQQSEINNSLTTMADGVEKFQLMEQKLQLAETWRETDEHLKELIASRRKEIEALALVPEELRIWRGQQAMRRQSQQHQQHHPERRSGRRLSGGGIIRSAQPDTDLGTHEVNMKEVLTGVQQKEQQQMEKELLRGAKAKEQQRQAEEQAWHESQQEYRRQKRQLEQRIKAAAEALHGLQEGDDGRLPLMQEQMQLMEARAALEEQCNEAKDRHIACVNELQLDAEESRVWRGYQSALALQIHSHPKSGRQNSPANVRRATSDPGPISSGDDPRMTQPGKVHSAEKPRLKLRKTRDHATEKDLTEGQKNQPSGKEQENKADEGKVHGTKDAKDIFDGNGSGSADHQALYGIQEESTGDLQDDQQTEEISKASSSTPLDCQSLVVDEITRWQDVNAQANIDVIIEPPSTEPTSPNATSCSPSSLPSPSSLLDVQDPDTSGEMSSEHSPLSSERTENSGSASTRNSASREVEQCSNDGGVSAAKRQGSALKEIDRKIQRCHSEAEHLVLLTQRMKVIKAETQRAARQSSLVTASAELRLPKIPARNASRSSSPSTVKSSRSTHCSSFAPYKLPDIAPRRNTVPHKKLRPDVMPCDPP